MNQRVPFQLSAKARLELLLKLSPTATHFEAVAHATLARALSEPGALGLGTIDHVLPFQISARVTTPVIAAVPVAIQVVALVQETPPRSSSLDPGRFGVVWSDQRVPFQPIASVRNGCVFEVVYSPTDTQADALKQEMPNKASNTVRGGFGLATTDQAVPSQRSVSVNCVPARFEVVPVAMQNAVSGHEIAKSWLPSVPGFWMGMRDQRVPSQRSAIASTL